MKTSFEKITPSMAITYLTLNTDNRPMREGWVKQLSEMIKNGEWQPTHQGIAFSVNGKLLDGQHRLSAIAKSGIPVNMLVIRDLPNDAFKTIDCGLKRTAADLTKLSSSSAEACRAAAAFTYHTGRFSADVLLKIYDCGFGALHEEIIAVAGKKIKFFSSASMRVAAVIMMMNGHDKQYIKNIYANLVHQNYDKLPTIAQQFAKQVNLGKLPFDKVDLLARGMKVFNPEYSDTGRLMITDLDVTSATSLCRETIKNAIRSSGV